MKVPEIALMLVLEVLEKFEDTTKPENIRERRMSQPMTYYTYYISKIILYDVVLRTPIEEVKLPDLGGNESVVTDFTAKTVETEFNKRSKHFDVDIPAYVKVLPVQRYNIINFKVKAKEK